MFAGFFVAENVEANEGLTLSGVKFAVVEEEEVEDESVSEEEEELVACKSKSALKKYAAELAAGTYVLDPLTGQIVDPLTGQVIADPASEATPATSPSASPSP